MGNTSKKKTAKQSSNNDKDKKITPIAIIGMGCLFPKSSNLNEYWRLIFNEEDGVTDIPATHWSLEDYYDENPKKPDHIYCKRGGFLSPVPFDPVEFGLPPSSLEATDTSQILGLVAAKMALEDAGYLEMDETLRDETSVILGVTGTQELVIPLGSRLGHPVWRKALLDSGIDAHKTDEVVQRISDSYVPWQENSFPGLLGNVVAGRISNRLNLGGTNCVVDAACASSLSAINLAILELMSGKSKMVLSGGVDTLNDIFMHMCFSKTQVLSPSSDVRPFSNQADGTVLGEGVGIVLLKRLEDAKNDHDKIYAVIRGIGSSSDGKSNSIYAPNPEGQVKALEKAYQSAGIDPSTVHLIEAHGTGTRVGDAVEFTALNTLYQKHMSNGIKCALGSVKSMIGHTKAAAGSAGLIKSVLSLYNKILPATLKAEEADPNLEIEKSPFYLNTKTRPWFNGYGHPRRSGVSAFGFGGSNFHLVLEEYEKDKPEPSWDGTVEIFAFSADSHKEMLNRIREAGNTFRSEVENSEINRLAALSRSEFSNLQALKMLIVAEKGDSLTQLFSSAIQVLEQNPDTRIKSSELIKNLYYSENTDHGKLAFLFPGQGSQYLDMAKDLVCKFPEAFKTFEMADQLNRDTKTSGKRISDYVYPLPKSKASERKIQFSDLTQTNIAQPAIGAASMAMDRILRKFGIEPDVVSGHSYGEITALCSAGWIDTETFFKLSYSRGRLMAEEKGQKGGMLAVQASLEEIESLLSELDTDLVLANRNSPNQGVLSGSMESIKKAESACQEKGMISKLIPVSTAFHTKMMEGAKKKFQTILSRIKLTPSEVLVFSNKTSDPYPKDFKEIRKVLAEQITHPVNFAGMILNMVKAGVKTFVEVGPKKVLTNLTQGILKDYGCRVLAIDGSSGQANGIADLARALCQLITFGHKVDLSQWENPVHGIKKQVMNIPILGTNYRNHNGNGKKVSTKIQADEKIKRNTESLESTQNQITQKLKKENSGVQQKQVRPVLSSGISKTESNINRSKKEDYRPTQMSQTKKENQTTPSIVLQDALKVVQEGLKSMQSLQTQTAKAHEKFLETQTQAGRTMQEMMERVQQLAHPGLTSGYSSDVQPQNKTAVPVSEPRMVQERAAEPEVQPHTDQLKTEFRQESNENFDMNPTSQEPIHDILSSVQSPNSVAHDPKLNLIDSTKVSETILEVVSELTGYPSDMLNLEMDIEADLGIDSIKRVEILSSLEEKMPELGRISPNVMGKLKTLQQISDHFIEQSDNNVNSNEVVPEVALRSDIENSQGIASDDIPPAPNILRSIPVPVESQFKTENQISIEVSGTDKLKKKILITDNGTPLANELKKALEARSFSIEFMSISDLLDANSWSNAAGLIILAPNAERLSPADSDLFLEQAFLLTQKVGPALIQTAEQNHAVFATITTLDGQFGLSGKKISGSNFGALAGLTKTASIEWEKVSCHAFDISNKSKKPVQLVQSILKDLFSAPLAHQVEIGFSGKKRYHIQMQDAPVSPSALTLNAEDTLIITGGARGVTAACTVQLAKSTESNLILLGRSPAPFEEPRWINGITDAKAIKSAIARNEKKSSLTPIALQQKYQTFMANREIIHTLNQIKAHGRCVEYYSLDIRDEKAVSRLLDSIRTQYGQISGIIHGAGVLMDKLILDKHMDQFKLVYETKVLGARALLKATAKDKLKYLVFFSSIASRNGNKGQVDYAMANEVINKMADQEAVSRTNTIVKAINWGPWDGGMVDDSLKKEFNKMEVGLIPLKKGGELFLKELGVPDSSEVILSADNNFGFNYKDSATSELSETELKDPLNLSLEKDFNIEDMPVLTSHVIGGTPVVPFALISDLIGFTAIRQNPGLHLYGIDQMRLLKGIKIENGSKPIKVHTGKAQKKGENFEVNVEIRNGVYEGQKVVHYQARAILSNQLISIPDLKYKTPIFDPYKKNVEEVYENVLFHGHQLQGLQQILGMSEKGMAARICSGPSPSDWMKKPLASEWTADPMVLDSAIQMATLWCFEMKNAASLPSFCAKYRQYQKKFPSKDITVILEVTDLSSRKMTGSFIFLNKENEVIAKMIGFEAIMDSSLIQAFRRRTVEQRKV